jgi:hypothetical protein
MKAFGLLSTFFFEKKVAKKQKTCRFIALSVLTQAESACTSPSLIFACGKNYSEPRRILRFADFSLSAK